MAQCAWGLKGSISNGGACRAVRWFAAFPFLPQLRCQPSGFDRSRDIDIR
jgi:hypothetical protein